VNADDPRRFPQWDRAQLQIEIINLTAKVVKFQKSKDKTLRGKLPQMQSDLHAMRLEAKRREIAALRERWNP